MNDFISPEESTRVHSRYSCPKTIKHPIPFDQTCGLVPRVQMFDFCVEGQRSLTSWCGVPCKKWVSWPHLAPLVFPTPLLYLLLFSTPVSPTWTTATISLSSNGYHKIRLPCCESSYGFCENIVLFSKVISERFVICFIENAIWKPLLCISNLYKYIYLRVYKCVYARAIIPENDGHDKSNCGY